MKSRLKLLSFVLASAGMAANAQADCTSREFSTAEASVIKSYIAYYGRVPDAAGFEFWSGELAKNGGDLAALINEFGTSDEFDSSFGDLSNDELIDNLFMQAFGRSADDAGKQFYLAELEAGRMTLANIALAILDGAQNGDARVIENKTDVAEHYLTNAESEGVEIDISDMKSVLTGVDAATSSKAPACADYTDLLAEAANDTTGLSCDNGSRGQPVKKIGILTGVSGLSYVSEAKESLGGIKKTISGETSATGEYEYFEACGESSNVTFCLGVKKNCGITETATGIVGPSINPESFSIGTRAIGRRDGRIDPFTIADVVRSTYPELDAAGLDEVITNAYQLLITLDFDADESNGLSFDDSARNNAESFADMIDFTLSAFDDNPSVLSLVSQSGRDALASETRAQGFSTFIQEINDNPGPFNPTDYDDFLYLSDTPDFSSPADFLTLDIISFPAFPDLLPSEPIAMNNFFFTTLLNNDFNVRNSKVNQDANVFELDFNNSTVAGTHETNQATIPGEIDLPDGTMYYTTWDYDNSGSYSKLTVWAFPGASTTNNFPEPTATMNDLDEAIVKYEFFAITPPSLFPEANTLLKITNDPNGDAKETKHLIKLEQGTPPPM